MGRAWHELSRLITITLGLAALACGNDRQPTTPDAGPAPDEAPGVATHTVPTGTTFEIRTHTVLSAAQNRPGDVFTASLVGPLVDDRGVVIVPGDALVRGRVTAAGVPDQVDQPAVIHLAFEAISFAGNSYPLQATIEQVIGRTGITAVRAAAIGPAAGTPIALETDDREAILARGTDLLIRVNEPVTINRRAPGVR